MNSFEKIYFKGQFRDYQQRVLDNANKYSKDGKIVAGETSIAFDSAAHLNKNLHVKMTYEGSTITTSLYDENNKLIVTGSRTNGAYTNMTDRNSTMARFVLRCEDGACEIDNFVFSIIRREG